MLSVLSLIATRFEMSASLHVRNLDEGLVLKLKRRAARHGRSAEAEHREILRAALSGEADTATWDELAAQLRTRTADRPQTSAEVLIREDRDGR